MKSISILLEEARELARIDTENKNQQIQTDTEQYLLHNSKYKLINNLNYELEKVTKFTYNITLNYVYNHLKVVISNLYTLSDSLYQQRIKFTTSGILHNLYDCSARQSSMVTFNTYSLNGKEIIPIYWKQSTLFLQRTPLALIRESELNENTI